MGIVIGFIPWIVYWILVGNIPFTTAVTIAFGITLLIQLILRVRHQPVHSLDVGTLIVFAVLCSPPTWCLTTCWNAGCSR